MHLLYVDDAGNTGTDYDNTEQPVFSLAGVVVNSNDWRTLNGAITAKKRILFPLTPNVEIHAANIFQGSNDRKNGVNYRCNTMEFNLFILESFLRLVAELGLPIISFTVRKQSLKAYCHKNYQGLIKIDPYFIAFPYMLSFFDSYLQTKQDIGIVFLDEQNSACNWTDEVQDRVQLFPNQDLLHVDRIIERAMYMDSCKNNFIQMADLCNFYINHYAAIKQGKVFSSVKMAHIEHMYSLIAPQIIDPPFDPHAQKDVFKFFDVNKELLS